MRLTETLAETQQRRTIDLFNFKKTLLRNFALLRLYHRSGTSRSILRGPSRAVVRATSLRYSSRTDRRSEGHELFGSTVYPLRFRRCSSVSASRAVRWSMVKVDGRRCRIGVVVQGLRILIYSVCLYNKTSSNYTNVLTFIRFGAFLYDKCAKSGIVIDIKDLQFVLILIILLYILNFSVFFYYFCFSITLFIAYYYELKSYFHQQKKK